jgi:hypothetical protein
MLEIRDLVCRYALAVDSRDLDMLVGLFVPDVAVGRDASGREALRSWYDRSLRSVGATIHFVANHTVDIDEDGAHGVVYCREEIEDLQVGEWRIGMLQYWDDYRRVDGAWLFERRRLGRWYSTDALARPQRGSGLTPESIGPKEMTLPDAFPTWGNFWEDARRPD